MFDAAFDSGNLQYVEEVRSYDGMSFCCFYKNNFKSVFFFLNWNIVTGRKSLGILKWVFLDDYRLTDRSWPIYILFWSILRLRLWRIKENMIEIKRCLWLMFLYEKLFMDDTPRRLNRESPNRTLISTKRYFPLDSRRPFYTVWSYFPVLMCSVVYLCFFRGFKLPRMAFYSFFFNSNYKTSSKSRTLERLIFTTIISSCFIVYY